VPHNVANTRIVDDIRDRFSDLHVEVVPISSLSSKTAVLKQSRPILIYVFIRTRHPCLAWFGTSSQWEAKRLIGQKSTRAICDFVAFLQVPAGVGYDSEFGKTTEYNTMNLAERLWPWCFLENRRRDQPYLGNDAELVQHLAMLLINAVEPLVKDNLKFRELNPIFDCPTHSVFDSRGKNVGSLVKHKRGVTILRDSAVFQEPFFWDPCSSASEATLTPEQDRLVKEGVLYKPGYAWGRHPLLVRTPYKLSSMLKARRFIAGNSSVRPSIVAL